MLATIQTSSSPEITNERYAAVWASRIGTALKGTGCATWVTESNVRPQMGAWPRISVEAQRTIGLLAEILLAPKDRESFLAMFERIVTAGLGGNEAAWKAAYDASKHLFLGKTGRCLSVDGAVAFLSMASRGNGTVSTLKALSKERTPLDTIRILNAAGHLMQSGRCAVADHLLARSGRSDFKGGVSGILRCVLERSPVNPVDVPAHWAENRDGRSTKDALNELAVLEDASFILTKGMNATLLSECASARGTEERFRWDVIAAVSRKGADSVVDIVRASLSDRSVNRSSRLVAAIQALAGGSDTEDVKSRHAWATSFDVPLTTIPAHPRLKEVRAEWLESFVALAESNGMLGSKGASRASFSRNATDAVCAVIPRFSAVSLFESLTKAGFVNAFDNAACSILKAIILCDRVDRCVEFPSSLAGAHFMRAFAAGAPSGYSMDEWVVGFLNAEAWGPWSDREFGSLALAAARLYREPSALSQSLVRTLGASATRHCTSNEHVLSSLRAGYLGLAGIPEPPSQRTSPGSAERTVRRQKAPSDRPRKEAASYAIVLPTVSEPSTGVHPGGEGAVVIDEATEGWVRAPNEAVPDLRIPNHELRRILRHRIKT